MEAAMPLTNKGEKIKSAMQEQYGKEKGEEVFYASENKGTIEGVHAKDSEEAPTPRRQPDLLGTVSKNNGIKPAEREFNDQDMMSSSGAPTAGMSSSSTGMSAGSTTSSAPTLDEPERDENGKFTSGSKSGAAKPAARSPSNRNAGAPERAAARRAANREPDSWRYPPSAMRDEAVSEKEIKSATPPMNNLSSPGNPGKTSGPVIPYSGVQVGDSLHNQNIRNRAFWSRKR
jgi:hypothetical protein